MVFPRGGTWLVHTSQDRKDSNELNRGTAIDENEMKKSLLHYTNGEVDVSPLLHLTKIDDVTLRGNIYLLSSKCVNLIKTYFMWFELSQVLEIK